MGKSKKIKGADPEALKLFSVARHSHLAPVTSLKDALFIFTHIPKTAGTTFDRIFEALDHRCGFARRRIDGTIYNQFLGEDKNENAGALNQFTTTDFDGIDFVAGHFPFGLSDRLDRATVNATILREPIARSRSQFLFGARRGGWSERTDPSEVYVAGHMIDNPQVRQIAGCTDRKQACDDDMLAQAIHNIDTQFDFVGVSERFDDFLRAIISALELPDIVYRKATVGPKYNVKMSRRLEMKLEPYNQYDQELYEYVVTKTSPFRDGLLALAPSSRTASRILVASPFVTLGGERYPLLSPEEFAAAEPGLRKNGLKLTHMG